MTRRSHPVVVARVGLGTALLLSPRRFLGGRDEPRAVAVARLLGARHLLEALVTNVRPAPPIARAGAAVDAIHALTAFGFAAAGPRRYRQLAIASGAGATAFALAGAHHALLLERGDRS